MHQANMVIQQEHHVTPRMYDVIHALNGARVFSKIELNAGYHQLHLDGRYITTFTTHLGLRLCKHLNFGISSTADVFQNAMSDLAKYPWCEEPQ